MARTATTAADKAQARKALAEQLQASIVEKVAALTSSDQWTRFLDQSAAFHAYSFKNVVLILTQCPEATAVAGYNQWLERGRHVRAGQKAIRIFGFSFKKITDTDPDTGEEETERRAPRFPILSVFDESQTDPNTELTPRMLKANPKAKLWADVEQHPAQRLTGADPDGIYGQVSDVMTARGWTITHRELDGHTNGYTTCDGTRQIVIEAALQPAQTAKTMIHEAAHALLHADLTGPDRQQMHRGIREVEAESVAYVLAGLLGLDTTSYSIGYIAEWAAADTDLIATTGKRVLDTVHTLTNELTPQPTEQTAAA
ncbi:ArdC-like ssDNA-binding domain-containing protein [Gordonia rubripertincta]|uniref:ArdC-like ssDNA-binding domain-containing protein n=1 Tax=Gordonia rubripertincta TaxID=36822 RepID=A0ABT4N352_GORRU|nr:ArdC-like ssDNA-binding domain-containing protein [Gordonia rubripertincta]MCZ4553673.1 ArdC-like ssDNA-binding domain-containing protein [Gordonia rubripertincta]